MADDSDCESDEADLESATPNINSNRNNSIHLSVRRSDITSTSIKEEADLGDLGIEAYDQSTYERKVFEQVDEAIAHVTDENQTTPNRPDLLNLLQTNDINQSSDDEVQGPPIDNDERVLQLARLERNRVNVKRERISFEETVQHQPSRLPKIPKLSSRIGNDIKPELDSTHEDSTSEQPSTSSILFWTPSITKHEISKNEPVELESESNANLVEELSDTEDDLDLNEDLDYETDEDLHNPNTSRKDPPKNLRKLKRVVDDADVDYYKKRIRDYIKERAKSRLNSIDEDGVETSQLDEFVIVEGQLQIPKTMWDGLFDHQRTGVKWLWELHQLGCGGILGDEMGLGKTIQTIAFLTALRQSKIPSSHKGYDTLGPTVLVCPATVMYQWLLEFRNWWPPFRVAILHSTGTYTGDWKKLVSSINKSQGILIVSYPGVVIYQDILHAFDWHYAILDEGHKIRNPDAQVTLACKRFRTPHRLILSGSPVQNNLKELWSIFDFIYPGKLGTLPVFMQQFATPITQGGYANASEIQVQIAYKCSCVLRDTIKPFLLRRTKAEVNNKLKLPERSEQVLFCKLTDRQYELYDNYLKSPTVRDIKSGLLQIFVGLTQLRKICNHPDLFDSSDRNNRNNKKSDHDSFDINSNRLNDRSFGCYKRSGKMMVVDALLKIWKKQGHKVLLFTQSRKMLRIFVKYLDEQQYKHLTMDGTTSIGFRQSIIDKFNNDDEIFIFLLTTRVGGVGINLVGANRIIIFDPDWNPSTDIQARERAWRIGQKRQVIIYRLLTAGTIEEKIYHRQVFKLYLTNRILRDAKQKRFFKTNDLHELFTLGDNQKNIETKALFDEDLQINPDDLAKRRKASKEKKNLDKEETRSHKKQMKLIEKAKNKQDKEKSKNKVKVKDFDNIKLSDEKIQAIRERAKKLSQMIASQYGSPSDTQSSNPRTNPFLAGLNTHSSSSGQVGNDKNPKSDHSNNKVSKSTERKSTNKDKPCSEYLVRQDVYRANCEPAENNNNSDKRQRDSGGISMEQQDYILDRLFKSSNVFGALKHDQIESDSTSDFKIVESEAEKVARDAIRVLRESRTMCMGSLTGVPNWTGRNGQFAPPPPTSNSGSVFGNRMHQQQSSNRLVPRGRGRAQQFLQKIGNSKAGASSSSSTYSGSPSSSASSPYNSGSSSLLSSIKKRTQKNPIQLARDTFGVGPPGDDEEDEQETRRNDICQGRSEGTGADKMADSLREFMLHKSASGTGDVQTSELLDFFNASFEPEATAVFKALLYKICNFKRLGDKGFWTIKNEFKDQ